MIVNSISNTSVVKCEGGSEEKDIVIVCDVEGGGVEWKDGFSILHERNIETVKEEKSEEERQKLRHGTISWEGEERRKEGERERGGREEMATDPTGKWMIGGSGRLSTVMEILQGVKVVGEERARLTVLST